MERITARWPDGRSVTFWDREISGDPADISPTASQPSAVNAAMQPNAMRLGCDSAADNPASGADR